MLNSESGSTEPAEVIGDNFRTSPFSAFQSPRPTGSGRSFKTSLLRSPTQLQNSVGPTHPSDISRIPSIARVTTNAPGNSRVRNSNVIPPVSHGSISWPVVLALFSYHTFFFFAASVSRGLLKILLIIFFFESKYRKPHRIARRIARQRGFRFHWSRSGRRAEKVSCHGNLWWYCAAIARRCNERQ